MAPCWRIMVGVLLLSGCHILYGQEREPALGSPSNAGPDAYVDALQRLVAVVEQPGLTIEERRKLYGGIPLTTLAPIFSYPLRPTEVRIARFVQDEILSQTEFRDDIGLLNAFLRQSHVLMQAFDKLHHAQLINRAEWIDAEIRLCADVTRFTRPVPRADRARQLAWEAAQEQPTQAGTARRQPASLQAQAERAYQWNFHPVRFNDELTPRWRAATQEERLRFLAACTTGPLEGFALTQVALNP
jgi:hypothetical protein